jgi:hypothetical protein
MQFGLFTLLVHEMAHVLMPFIRGFCVRRADFPKFEFLHTCQERLVRPAVWAVLDNTQRAVRSFPRSLRAGGGWIDSVESGQLLEQLWRGAASTHDQRSFPRWTQELNLPLPPVREDEPVLTALESSRLPNTLSLRYQTTWPQARAAVMPTDWIARFLPFIQSGGARGHIVCVPST